MIQKALPLLLMLAVTRAQGGNRATKILQTAETTLRGESTQALLTMKVQRPNFTRNLKVRVWTLGNDRAMVEILKPEKEEGVMSLRVESRMWNYLPKVDSTVRVPTSMMLQSWMGSDFTNDDLMQSSSVVADYTHRILKTGKVNGQDSVLIRCLPRKGRPVVWGKIHYWARKKDSLPVRQVFFDKRGREVRTLNFTAFRKMDDRVIPTRVTVTLKEDPGHSTTVRYLKALYNRKLDESFFNREKLRRTSQKGKVLAGGWVTAPMTRRTR